jgi:mannose-6-phosphate isomerase-like protein (cupin superfamily)
MLHHSNEMKNASSSVKSALELDLATLLRISKKANVVISKEPKTVNTQDATATHDSSNGEWLQARPGERLCIRVPAAHTNSMYSLTEIIASPGDSTPVHIHHNEDEHFHVLEGTLRFLYGDKMLDVSAGKTLTVLRGVEHAWGNATAVPVRMLITFTPGGCEEALREIALAGDDVDLMAISKHYGVSVVGPPLLD